MPRRQQERRRRAEAARDLQNQLEDRERALAAALERLRAARGLPVLEEPPDEVAAPAPQAGYILPNGDIHLVAQPGGIQFVNNVNVGWFNDDNRLVMGEPAAPRPMPTAESEVRARELLRSLLRPAQREHFDANGWIIERGGLTGDEYWIAPAWAGNVVAFCPLDVERVDVRTGMRFPPGIGRRFCIHPPRPAPIGDVMASQVLMIRGREDKFVNTAIANAPETRETAADLMASTAYRWPHILEGGMWAPPPARYLIFPDVQAPAG